MAPDHGRGAPRGGMPPTAPRGRRRGGRGRGAAATRANADGNGSSKITTNGSSKDVKPDKTDLSPTQASPKTLTSEDSGMSNNAHGPPKPVANGTSHSRSSRRGKRGGGSRKQSEDSTSGDQTASSTNPLPSEVAGMNGDRTSKAADMAATHTATESGSAEVKSLQQIQAEQEAERKKPVMKLDPPTGPKALAQKGVSQPRKRPQYQKLAVETHHTDLGHAGYPATQGLRSSMATDSFARPPAPTNRKIFDPTKFTGLPHPSRDRPVAIYAQAQFLERVAVVHINNTEITDEELYEKEAWRLELQDLCRAAVSYYARQTMPDFDPISVKLKCFGSLRAGFATKASDMDLALVSPDTDADPNFDDSIIPRLLEHVLLVQGYGARLLTRTRVPILKLCEMPTPELRENLISERLKWEESQRNQDMSGHKKDNEEADVHVQGEDVADHTNGQEDGVEALAATQVEELEFSEPNVTHGKGRPEPKGLAGRSNEELLRLFKLAMIEGWYEPAHRDLIAHFADCVEESHGEPDNPVVVDARQQLHQLPDILSRYREPVDNRLDFPKIGVGIQCDINFNNPLALHNTALLRCYNLCDPRIKNMILFVKAWAKRRDINKPYRGTLSSYGYVLMVLHYVVNIASPALAPNLQLQLGPARGGAPGTPTSCNGYNVQFWRNERQILHAAQNGMLGYSEESLGSLLRGFFAYFGEHGPMHVAPQGGFNWTRSVLSLRTEGGLLSKEEKGWTGARTDVVEATTGEKPVEVRQRYLFAIEDPFETEHNVARPVVHNGICAIRDEFRRAHRIIKCAGVIDGQSHDLFAEYTHTELDREIRYFGPNPANAPKPKNPGSKPGRIGAAGQNTNGTMAASGHVPSNGPKISQLPHRPGKNGASPNYRDTIATTNHDDRRSCPPNEASTGHGGKVSHFQAMRENARFPNEELQAAGLVDGPLDS